jgi:DNA-binding CsgD family transcriptional regulator
MRARSKSRLMTTSLTPFEARIFELRASGMSRREVAWILHRAPQTISNALTIAKEKLGATSLLEAALLVSVLTHDLE